MKNLLLVLFIIYTYTYCVSACYAGNKNSVQKPLDINAVGEAIENKCRTAGNPKLFQHALEEFGDCTNNLFRDLPSPPNLSTYNPDHCTYFKKVETRICARNFTKNISPCLAENEVYIQQMLLNAFDDIYEELCGANGISNQQYIYEKVNQTAVCMQMAGTLLAQYGSCKTGSLNIFKELDDGILNLNKQDVCCDLKSLQKCTTQLTEAMCNVEFSRLTDLVFQPFLESCNELDANK